MHWNDWMLGFTRSLTRPEMRFVSVELERRCESLKDQCGQGSPQVKFCACFVYRPLQTEASLTAGVTGIRLCVIYQGRLDRLDRCWERMCLRIAIPGGH